MATWVFILFLFGLLAWVVNLFGILPWFTPWWAIGLMATAFVMLMQIGDREKEGEREKLSERIQELEGLLKFE